MNPSQGFAVFYKTIRAILNVGVEIEDATERADFYERSLRHIMEGMQEGVALTLLRKTNVAAIPRAATSSARELTCEQINNALRSCAIDPREDAPEE